MKNIVPTPVTLTADELKTVIKLVSVRGAEYGAARICRLLAGEHSLTAHEISEASDISNVSDMVLRCINPRLKSTDLYVACEKPPQTNYVRWSFYRDWAANDPDWSDLDKRLGAELVQEIAQTRNLEDAKRYVQRITAMSAVGGSE
jgi:hypothetical protein